MEFTIYNFHETDKQNKFNFHLPSLSFNKSLAWFTNIEQKTEISLPTNIGIRHIEYLPIKDSDQTIEIFEVYFIILGFGVSCHFRRNYNEFVY